MAEAYDAIVVGSGPNGLAAAVRLVDAGFSTLLVEASERVGGGLRSGERTLPGFLHDLCSAVHTMGVLSPYFNELPLEQYGLSWAYPEASVAHPLDGRPAAMLEHSLDDTARLLGPDARTYRKLLTPFLRDARGLLRDLLAPLGVPSHPLAMLRFGLSGLRSARGFAGRFQSIEARALFAGCAGHSILPFDRLGTAAFGLLFLLTGHVERWPAIQGGSEQLARALLAYFLAKGGEVRTGFSVRRLSELPESRVVLFDLSPKALDEIAGDALPAGYRKRLRRYVYGPGVFKIDYALSHPIPWDDPNVARASTVHVGGTFEEIAESERAVWENRVAERPYLILCQQSHFDTKRAPTGQHTGYVYCHVPPNYEGDMTRAIEDQIERFAPGFRDTVLARAVSGPRDFERYNPSYVGGAITGGAALITQLFTRPVARLDPYSTPNPRLFLCSHATPPGGGVHGMCGYYAARSAIRRLQKSAR